MIKFLVLLFFSFVFYTFPGKAQRPGDMQYPALLWEITGNGLKKPSYLFGTMHVSNKLAFHLSDSFYYALKNVEAVALELNPELWQPQMIRLNKLNDNYTSFSRAGGSEYFTEKSFRLTDFSKELQLALSTEPPVVNSLLYRAYQEKQDFEEDTFLDLYIFQTGRKLGKQAAGVEDYYQSEKLVLEAYMDMAREKQIPQDLGEETTRTLSEKLENAYRRGDLDLMDSINNLLDNSKAFKEKFLYQRNDIQAKSIDTIIRTRSLFVGVGAAHLPGSRGVIQQLREMGYTLRPIKMTDRDAAQKELLEDVHVPVVFQKQFATDSVYSVKVPGTLYSLQNNAETLNRAQFADMNNGAYYMVTRVKTHAAFLGLSPENILKKTDSLLYENIPGKILSKTNIVKNGLKGWDVQNRTRTGNLQHYQIFTTPFEILIFKMSGRGEYVKGEEGTTFFNSIALNAGDGLKNSSLGTDPDRFEYAVNTNNESYLTLRVPVNNYNFIDNDSFALTMMQESFHNPDLFTEEPKISWSTYKGNLALNSIEALKDSGRILSVFFLHGPDCYAVSKRTMSATDESFAFANNINFPGPIFKNPEIYVDSFLKFKVLTPVKPNLDAGIRNVLETSINNINKGLNATSTVNYWHATRNAVFKDDASGQQVAVSMQEYPKYFSIKDTAKFWKDIIDSYVNDDLILEEKRIVKDRGDAYGYYLSFTDTGTIRHINRLVLLQNDRIYSVTTLNEGNEPAEMFKKTFFDSFQPFGTDSSFNNTATKTDLFFRDYYSTDSAEHNLAVQGLSNIYFTANDAPQMAEAIRKLQINDRDYFDIKTKFITELGYIEDGDRSDIPGLLEQLYKETADTVLFQNEILKSLSRLKTKKSFSTLLDIMMQDPPVFKNEDDYYTILKSFNDTLLLSKHYIKQLLALTTISDYKGPVIGLLVALVQEEIVSAKEYKKYFTPIYIDARLALKKQGVQDEEKMQEQLLALQKPEEANDSNDDYDRDTYENAFNLYDYAVLLMPFYDKDKKVPEFFEKLLKTRSIPLLLSTAVLMEKNKKPVSQGVWESLASNEKYAGRLYSLLQANKQLEVFPEVYKNQVQLARSFMLQLSSYKKLDAVEFIKDDTATINGITGRIFYFKYRVKPTDEWKIGIAGLQPLDKKKIWDDQDFNSLTEKRLLEYEPLELQLNKQYKRLEYSLHKSGIYFFQDDESAVANYDY